MRHTQTTARRGFTLVELLVAAALCVLVMYVLAQAFKAGIDTLSQLKSVAGLADQLRVAETIIRRDLGAQHLEDEKGNAVLVSTLGDPQNPTYSGSWASPRRGFFKVVQKSQIQTNTTAAYRNEGSDGNGIPSAYATDHWLQFTCKLSGRSAVDVFTATGPPNGSGVVESAANLADFATAITATPATFAGRWGEVTYFLASPRDLMPGDVTNAQKLLVLYRRARVLAPPGVAPPGPAAITIPAPASVMVDPTVPQSTFKYPDLGGYFQTSGSQTSWTMSAPDQITDPQYRLSGANPTPPVAGPALVPATPTLTPQTASGNTAFPLAPLPLANTTSTFNTYGSDILLMNVVSMRVQVLNAASLAYEDIGPASPTIPVVWDTFLINDLPPRIRGVRVELRVYDPKNKVTRQVTIAQPL